MGVLQRCTGPDAVAAAPDAADPAPERGLPRPVPGLDDDGANRPVSILPVQRADERAAAMRRVRGPDTPGGCRPNRGMIWNHAR